MIYSDQSDSQTNIFSMEAEQSVLGGILLDNSEIDHASGIIKPEDFFYILYLPMHQSIDCWLGRFSLYSKAFLTPACGC
jgi:hypothetical protein